MPRAKEAPRHRAGFVALIGEPNAGKSTLLNRLLGQKVAIVSPKPQTTRTRILGVLHAPEYQLAVVDTPGIHRPGARSTLGREMLEVARGAIGEVDVAALVVDAKRPPGLAGAGDELRALLARDRPNGERKRPRWALIVNKVDLVSRPLLLPFIDAWQRDWEFDLVFPLSALKGENVEGLPAALAELVPEGPPLFPPETWTDQEERTLAAELVREQVLKQTSQEIPYSVAVEIEQFDESKRTASRPLVRILATLHVERSSQKGILIGRGGARLRAIGTAARHEIEQLLGCKVFLGLNVRVEERWTESGSATRRFGYGPKH